MIYELYKRFIRVIKRVYFIRWLIKENDGSSLKVLDGCIDDYRNRFKNRYDTKYDRLFINYSRLIAHESKCKKMKVGAVIVKDNRSISMGYNGSISGADNCCEDVMEDGSLKTRDGILHAEENAILYSAKIGLSLDGCSIYITHMPCIRCARMIVSVGIKKVVYLNEYRDRSGIELLRENGLTVYKYDEDIIIDDKNS